MNKKEISEWEEIFRQFLDNENVRILCPHCKRGILKFKKKIQEKDSKKRIHVGSFCDNCMNTKNITKIFK